MRKYRKKRVVGRMRRSFKRRRSAMRRRRSRGLRIGYRM